MMMEVVGRHALLFDDDASSAFVNSREALVDWNSLLIDRYDVRHLLQSPLSPPPPFVNNSQSEQDEEEFVLDQIRYQDLPPSPSNDADDQIQSSPLLQDKNGTEPANGGTYNAVSFSYGKTDASLESRDSDVPGFLPPFPVPESLLQSLPPTEKLHHIMARTAIFVSEHGGQSEIVLRVKQGNNPTFGFLMPDHYLHVYFRFLVDNQKLLKSDNDTKPEEMKKGDQEKKQTEVAGGALSLLGSVYGSGEDEDGATQIVSEFKENKPVNASNSASGTLCHGSQLALSPGYSTELEVAAPQHPLTVYKAKGLLSKKRHSVNTITSITPSSKKKEGMVLDLLPKTDTSWGSTPSNTSLIEHSILEPPSEMKRMMDKTAEYILRNGIEFEKVLIEQDHSKGRFPFLLPFNQYYPYYLKTFQKFQELKQPGSAAHKLDLMRHIGGKRSTFKDSDTLSNGSALHDFPYDLDKKEKFKMVITGSKKDAQEPAPKPSEQQCGMSVDAAAAILQAATRGMRNPKLELSKKGILDDSFQGSTSKPASKNESSMSIPAELSRLVGLSKESSATNNVSVAKAVSKTAAIAAASETDSSESGLTKEQKQKAERLKRAKMFAALIKSGAANQTNELAELTDSVVSGLAGSGCRTEGKGGFADSFNLSDASIVDVVSREREGSSNPVKCRKMDSENDYKEWSRKRQHFRSRRVREEGEDDVDDDAERNHKHSKRRRHSFHSSHHSKDEHKHRKRHSSSKDRESRHRHEYHSSSEDDRHHTRRSYKRRASHSERKIESEVEKGEMLVHKSDKVMSGEDASRVTSSNLVNDRWDGSTPTVEAQLSNGTQVSDDLRAKVRAMLLATL
ncbi:SWAP (Suppressor-of-White-APricot)/surp domain-containing protein [Thalictrum thalictroides]|uniref:SWAP (Suppressor-of-White-APricot)/surp domain-containing protein n=1 Tax=Thalictrum thalictroides TaxID=46969 RepID=A0A7J6UT94_THATH|nr:SWAP (Suppressor-of-White-APricot)/surp domain-containing protein [Thalictrum thalictroides]